MKPSILTAKLLNTNLTIHGENHSKIDNTYYESLKFSGKELLFVEHSNNACELKPEDEPLFKAHAKGSEWIFYTQKKSGNPNVVCFDTRSEQGYLNAFEEKAMLDAADNLAVDDPNNVRLFIDMAMKTMIVLSKNKAIFDENYFEQSYELLDTQMKAVIKLLQIKKAKGVNINVLGMPLAKLLPGVAYTFAYNLRTIASVSVDMGLSNALLQFAKKGATDIHVFCGKNHLVRMSKMLPLSNMKITCITKELEESASPILQGDHAFEKKILELA
jgi:hypothetical protein